MTNYPRNPWPGRIMTALELGSGIIAVWAVVSVVAAKYAPPDAYGWIAAPWLAWLGAAGLVVVCAVVGIIGRLFICR